jgi:hypothetical protein
VSRVSLGERTADILMDKWLGLVAAAPAPR